MKLETIYNDFPRWVDGGDIVVILDKFLNAQSVKIEELESEIEELKSEIEELKSEIEELT